MRRASDSHSVMVGQAGVKQVRNFPVSVRKNGSISSEQRRSSPPLNSTSLIVMMPFPPTPPKRLAARFKALDPSDNGNTLTDELGLVHGPNTHPSLRVYQPLAPIFAAELACWSELKGDGRVEKGKSYSRSRDRQRGVSSGQTRFRPNSPDFNGEGQNSSSSPVSLLSYDLTPLPTISTGKNSRARGCRPT